MRLCLRIITPRQVQQGVVVFFFTHFSSSLVRGVGGGGGVPKGVRSWLRGSGLARRTCIAEADR